MADSWIKLFRKLRDWEWYKDSKTLHLFIHLLIEANYRPGKWRGHNLSPGQLITGRKQLAADTRISEQSIRTCLNRLKLTGEITLESTKQFSIITICNFSLYQGENKQGNQQLTNDQPTANQQPTTSKKLRKKERKKEEMKEEHSASDDAASSTTTIDSPFYLTKKNRRLTGKRLESFARFWMAFNYKRGKAEASDAWLDIPELTDSLVERICHAASQEAVRRPQLKANGKTPKMAQGWIAGRRWEDDLQEVGPNTGNAQTDQNILVAREWAAKKRAV